MFCSDCTMLLLTQKLNAWRNRHVWFDIYVCNWKKNLKSWEHHCHFSLQLLVMALEDTVFLLSFLVTTLEVDISRDTLSWKDRYSIKNIGENCQNLLTLNLKKILQCQTQIFT